MTRVYSPSSQARDRGRCAAPPSGDMDVMSQVTYVLHDVLSLLLRVYVIFAHLS